MSSDNYIEKPTSSCYRNNVTYTNDDVIILPGYPRIENGKLSVAFLVSLPNEAIPSNNDATVISQDTLLTIAAVATAAIIDQTGAQVHNVGRYTVPATMDSSKSTSNLALILCLTLIPAIIIISAGTAFG